MGNPFQRYLKDQGLKLTGQRELIFKIFSGVQGHISSDELYLRVKKVDPTVGQATVFRFLRLLADSGIAQTSGLGGRGTRYELKRRHHDHLICTQCGVVTEFKNESIEEEQARVASRYGFVLKDHRMELYGLCPSCTRKAEKEKPPLTIADLKNGQTFRVARVTLAREIGKRLADMGFVKGAEGRVVRSALLGDPLQVKILHYDVSLRRSEASGIEVEALSSKLADMSKKTGVQK